MTDETNAAPDAADAADAAGAAHTANPTAAGPARPADEATRTPASVADLRALAGDQLLEVVEHAGVRYTLLGTAHVSKTSAETVAALGESGYFDAVAIELDA